MKFKVPFIKPSFPDAEEISQDYREIVEANWFTNFGPFEQRFSEKAARFISDGAYATTISNCTLGIEAAIDTLFNKQKRKVIVPSFTFAAGPEILIKSGFTPIFIDIQPEDWQPSLQQARDLLQANSKDYAGILLCNIFGVGNERISEWEELAAMYALPLIIDTAAGFGSQYTDDEKVGLRGDCEVFSFHATKPFAVGEGGLVSSRNPEIIQKIRSWQNFGFEQDRNVHRFGSNAKLQEINAAIGLRQLSGFEERLKQRRKSLRKYKELLVPGGFEFQPNDTFSTVAFVSVLARTKDEADKLVDRLLANSIEVRRYYTPLHKQKMLLRESEAPVTLSVTEEVASRVISLPLHDNMPDDEVESIAKLLTGDMQ